MKEDFVCLELSLILVYGKDFIIVGFVEFFDLVVWCDWEGWILCDFQGIWDWIVCYGQVSIGGWNFYFKEVLQIMFEIGFLVIVFEEFIGEEYYFVDGICYVC